LQHIQCRSEREDERDGERGTSCRLCWHDILIGPLGAEVAKGPCGGGRADVEDDLGMKVVRAAWSPRRGDGSEDLGPVMQAPGSHRGSGGGALGGHRGSGGGVLASRMPTRWRRHECGNALAMEATGREWEWAGTGES